jgi:hypothetical protein
MIVTQSTAVSIAPSIFGDIIAFFNTDSQDTSGRYIGGQTGQYWQTVRIDKGLARAGSSGTWQRRGLVNSHSSCRQVASGKETDS